MAMEVTFDKLNKIQNALRSIPVMDIKGAPINDRLSWAIKRYSDKNERVIKEMAQGEIDMQREYASVDDKNNFIINKVGQNETLSFTKEKQAELTKAFDKYMASGKCNIEPYVCKDIERSKTLPLWTQVELDGIVLMLDPEIKKFMDEENG